MTGTLQFHEKTEKILKQKSGMLRSNNSIYYRPVCKRHSLKRMDHYHHYAVKRATMERIYTKEIIYCTNQFVTYFYVAIILLELCGFITKYNIILEIILNQCFFLHL